MTGPTRPRIHVRSIAIVAAIAATVSFLAGERVGLRIGEAHAVTGVPAVALACAAVPGDDGPARTPAAGEEPAGVGADCNTQVR